MGGSDQWGNIVSGIELGRRTDGIELFGVTSPLLTTASGAKMGKTAAGAVWLNPDMCSPYDYWQYWRNSEDADVERFLKLFTELPLKEIATLAKLKGAELNEAKKILATEATALVHGRDAADRAAETARATFEEGLDRREPADHRGAARRSGERLRRVERKSACGLRAIRPARPGARSKAADSR